MYSASVQAGAGALVWLGARVLFSGPISLSNLLSDLEIREIEMIAFLQEQKADITAKITL